MIKSMTGFASLQGDTGVYAWEWTIRTVNARNLEIRLRLPSWLERDEQTIRRELAKPLKRGSATVTARIRGSAEGMADQIDSNILKQRIAQIAAVESASTQMDVTLANTNAADILSLPGVLAPADNEETDALRETLMQRLPDLIAELNKERQNEGQALAHIIKRQIRSIEQLLAKAKGAAEARSDQVASKLRERVANLIDDPEAVDDSRLEQEIALIAVKADVTEEMDRLQAHVSSAKQLLESKDAAGRKLDFLAQEFNREANTLCAKAQSSELTRLGLDLKATIDQMREQLQNVE